MGVDGAEIECFILVMETCSDLFAQDVENCRHVEVVSWQGGEFCRPGPEAVVFVMPCFLVLARQGLRRVASLVVGVCNWCMLTAWWHSQQTLCPLPSTGKKKFLTAHRCSEK